MKRLFLLVLFSSVFFAEAQNVGIGTNNPLALLHVADSGVVFTGPFLPSAITPFAPPVSGSGTRMMWYPEKGAFRAGTVTGLEWDKENIGLNSFGLGKNTIASGESSVSLGLSGIASGPYSVSLGWSNVASSFGSTSMGVFNSASGDYAFSAGFSNSSVGMASSTMGINNMALGNYSTSMGSATTATAFASTSMGSNTKSKSPSGLAIGLFNDTTSSDRLFEIGNGFDDNTRRNAFTVLYSGNVGIGITNPFRPLSFAAKLEKKVSFYPGASGDAGVSVFNNDLRIYADNMSARVSFGYDDYAAGFTSRAYILASGSTAMVVQGNMTVNGTNYNSDARFKQHVQPLSGSLQKLNALQGVQYEMRINEFPDRNFLPGTEIGLIAQEVEKVLPELVRTESDGYKSVDYAKLVPVLVEAIKEQQLEIRKLEEKVNKLTEDHPGRKHRSKYRITKRGN